MACDAGDLSWRIVTAEIQLPRSQVVAGVVVDTPLAGRKGEK